MQAHKVVLIGRGSDVGVRVRLNVHSEITMTLIKFESRLVVVQPYADIIEQPWDTLFGRGALFGRRILFGTQTSRLCTTVNSSRNGCMHVCTCLYPCARVCVAAVAVAVAAAAAVAAAVAAAAVAVACLCCS